MVINVFKYKKYFKNGLWHVHTNYTDGKHSVDELCRYAIRKDYPLIAFTEHVRKKLNYNFDKYLRDINNARKKYSSLIILSGVEAKILPGGDIDCSEEILKKVDLVLLAEHGFSGDYDEYINSLKKGLQNKYVNVWAHPGLLLKKKGWKAREFDIKDLASNIANKNLAVELNRRYSNILPLLYQTIPEELLIFAQDLHDL